MASRVGVQHGQMSTGKFRFGFVAQLLAFLACSIGTDWRVSFKKFNDIIGQCV